MIPSTFLATRLVRYLPSFSSEKSVLARIVMYPSCLALASTALAMSAKKGLVMSGSTSAMLLDHIVRAVKLERSVE